MSRYSVGPSYEWSAECDVCRKKTKASLLRKRWDGYMVCDEDFETRHEADFYEVRNDVHVLPFIRSPGKDTVTPFPLFSTISDYNSTTNPVVVTSAFQCYGTPSAQWQSANFGPSISIAAWVYPRISDGRQNIISTQYNGTAQTFSFDIMGGATFFSAPTTGQSLNGLQFSVHTGAQGVVGFVSVPNVLVLHKWQHVCYTRDDTTQTEMFYVDGNPVMARKNSGIAYQSITNLADEISIGKRVVSSGTNPMAGGIADIRVWAGPTPSSSGVGVATLDLNQVRWNMQNQSPSLPEPTTALHAWWKLNEGNGATSFADSGGYGNTITIHNSSDLTWGYGVF